MRRVPILLYHSVGSDTSGPLGPYTTSVADFRDQMAWVADQGYSSLTVSEYASALAGVRDLPERPVLITFDDGFADFTRNALPLLQAYGHVSTMFVTTAGCWSARPRRLGGRRTLSRAEVACLPSAGVEVGAHSHEHLHLDLLPAGRVADELRRCKEILEQVVQAEVPSFAYPHGSNRAATRRLVREAGFSSACAVKNEVSHLEDDPWRLARIMLTRDQSVPFLRQALAGSALPAARKREQVRTTAWRVARFARTRGRPEVVVTDA